STSWRSSVELTASIVSVRSLRCRSRASIRAQRYAHRVSKTDWLLMLHIAAAFCLVGGSPAAAILNVLAVRSEKPSEAAFLLKLIRSPLPLIFAGVLGTLFSGLWLWHDLGFGFGTGWIWAALVL